MKNDKYMKRYVVGTWSQCIGVLRKSEYINSKHNNAYDYYELEEYDSYIHPDFFAEKTNWQHPDFCFVKGSTAQRLWPHDAYVLTLYKERDSWNTQSAMSI